MPALVLARRIPALLLVLNLDAAFMQADFGEARRRYAGILESDPEHAEPRLLQKMSDVYFPLGDFEKERLYRERVYGHLSGGY